MTVGYGPSDGTRCLAPASHAARSNTMAALDWAPCFGGRGGSDPSSDDL